MADSTNERVVFRRGPSETLPQTRVAGTLLIAVDTGEVYVDHSNTTRVQLKDSTKLPLTGGTVTGDLDVQGGFAIQNNNDADCFKITASGVSGNDAMLAAWQDWLGLSAIADALRAILGV